MGMFDDLIPAGTERPGGMFDDLVPKVPPQAKGLIAKAIEPITSYPATQAEMAHSGVTRMGEGVDQIKSGINLAMSPGERAKMTPAEQAGAGPLAMAKGAANVAMGGLEYVGSPITAAYRTVVGRPIEENTGIPKEYTEFGAMLATPGLGLTRLPKAPPRVSSPPVSLAPLTPGGEVAEAGQRLGVDLPRAVTTDSGTMQQAGKIGSNIPIVGTPLRSASEEAITGLGDAATATRDAYGAGSQAMAGSAVREGIKENLANGPIKQRVSELYDRVDSLVDPVTTGQLPNTRNLVNTINGRRVNAALPSSDAVKDLQQALARPGMNYEGIKDLRSHYGGMIDGDVPIPQGMSSQEVKNVYGALSNDMRLIIAKAGGQDGLRAYNQAESAAKEWAGIRSELARVLKVQSEEGIFDKISAMAGSTSRADLDMLGKVRVAVGSKNWDEVASAVIGKMGWPPGGTGFSPDAFLTAYKKMSEEGRAMLFRTPGHGSHADAIADIAKVSERFKELNKFANPSGTGQVVAGATELFGASKAAFAGGFVEPMTFIGGIVGGRILSHILARPMTTRAMAMWAKDYEAAVAAKPTPQTMNKLEASSRVFAAAVGKDFGRPDLVPDLMRRLQGAIPSSANQEQPQAPRVIDQQP